jgi:hypothetical protein
MNEKKARNRLEEMSNLISSTIDSANERDGVMYEYSASYSEPASRLILGTWNVTEHTVGDIPYRDIFVKNSFGDAKPEDMSYEATYEFMRNLCVKRVLICGFLATEDGRVPYEYRMNLVLLWDIRGKSLSVQPVTGYQCTLVDGKPASIRDLPPNPEWSHVRVFVSDRSLILEDGEDRKTLARINA